MYREYSAANLQLAVQHEDARFIGRLLRYGAATLTGTPSMVEISLRRIVGNEWDSSTSPIVHHINSWLRTLELAYASVFHEGEFWTVHQRPIHRDPHLAARFFIDRSKMFMTTVLEPKFEVTDHWGRFEDTQFKKQLSAKDEELKAEQ